MSGSSLAMSGSKVVEVHVDTVEISPVTDTSPLLPKDGREEAGGPADGLPSPSSSSSGQTQRLLLPFFLYCLAVGSVAGPKLTVILALLCIQQNPHHPPRHRPIFDDDICSHPAAHAQMAHFMAYANLISGTLCAICSPRLLTLSDRYGRRPPLALSILGMLFGDSVSLLAAAVPVIPAKWMLLEFVVGGLTGAFATTVTLAQLCVADGVEGVERTRSFGRLHACMYLGMGLGPATGAWILRVAGGRLVPVFVVALVCHLLFFAYVLFVLPVSAPLAPKIPAETTTHPDPSTPPTLLTRIIRFCNVLQPLQIFRQTTNTARGRARLALPILALIDTITFGVQTGLPSLLIIFSSFRFGWKSFETSLFLSLINITRALCLGILLPILVPKPQPHASNTTERTIFIVRASVLLEALGQCGFAASRSPGLFSFSGVLAAMGSPVSPVAQSAMTLYVDSDRWGELFGATSLLHSLARATVPVLMQTVYGLTLRSASGVVFLTLGMGFGLMFLLSLVLTV